MPIVDEVLAEQVVVTGDAGERANLERPLDFRQQRQPLSIIGGNTDVVLLDDPQVVLDQPEHVEVLQEARRCVQTLKRLGHAPCHPLRLQGLCRHRGSFDELENHHVQLRDVFQHSRTDAGAGRSSGVMDLIYPVNR